MSGYSKQDIELIKRDLKKLAKDDKKAKRFNPACQSCTEGKPAAWCLAYCAAVIR